MSLDYKKILVKYHKDIVKQFSELDKKVMEIGSDPVKWEKQKNHIAQIYEDISDVISNASYSLD